MSFFEFPNTRTYDNDLGWLIKAVKDIGESLENFINYNSLKYADPIAWNITTQYEANTIVIDQATGDAYLSTRPVPSGVAINNTEYWTPIFNYGENLNILREQIAAANEENSNTATKNYTADELVWVQGRLYKCLVDFLAGTAFVEGTNIAHTTIEDLLDILFSNVTEINSNIQELNEYNQEHDIDYVTPQMFGAVADGVTDDSAAINAAIATEKPVIFPAGEYAIASSINLHHCFHRTYDMSNAIIKYSGTDYAIDVSYVDWCNIYIDRIEAPNGSCIKIHSDAGNNHVQYDNFYIRMLVPGASGTCIFINPSAAGWCNELRFYNTQCAAGLYGVRIRNDSPNYGCNQHTFINISPEGTNTLFKLEAASHPIGEILVVGCRAHENHQYLYDSSGNVYTVRHIMTRIMYPEWLNLSGNCEDWYFDCPYQIGSDRFRGAYILSGTTVTPAANVYMSTKARTIAANTDLNQIMNGRWFMPFASVSTVSNLPDGYTSAAYLTQYGDNSGTYCTQVLQTYYSDISYIRFGNKTANQWSAWLRQTKVYNYTDETVTLTFGANSVAAHAAPTGKKIYMAQLLYSYNVFNYGMQIYPEANGNGYNVVGNSRAASQSAEVTVRLWYDS